MICDLKAVKPLIKALGDSALEDFARAKTAWALGEIGDQKALEPLIKALGDKNGWVQMDAAEALGKLKNAKAVESLIKALSDGWVSVPM